MIACVVALLDHKYAMPLDDDSVVEVQVDTVPDGVIVGVTTAEQGLTVPGTPSGNTIVVSGVSKN